MLTNSIGASVRLVTTLAPDVWHVAADSGELELAVVNLVLNARDAMPQGGVITVAAENVWLAHGDTPAGLEGDFVALSVADRGCGIADDILPKIFDPFFTTKGLEKGTGLGLSQAHGFAHQSGGTITVRSKIGEGTCVTIYLPRAAAAALPASRTADEPRRQLAPRRALLVDDNPDVLQVSKILLEQLGYRVHAVVDASAALQEIDKARFDLVLSDIVMAGAMDGLGLARAIRERRAEIPVVLVTGYSDVMAEAAREFTVLRKPYELEDLSRAAAAANARSRRQASASNLVSFRDVKRGRAAKGDPSAAG